MGSRATSGLAPGRRWVRARPSDAVGFHVVETHLFQAVPGSFRVDHPRDAPAQLDLLMASALMVAILHLLQAGLQLG